MSGEPTCLACGGVEPEHHWTCFAKPEAVGWGPVMPPRAPGPGGTAAVSAGPVQPETAFQARRRKALAVVRESRLTLLHVHADERFEVQEVVARVRSSRAGGATYAVDYLDGTWTCTCRAGGGCPHDLAARLVTGHAG